MHRGGAHRDLREAPDPLAVGREPRYCLGMPDTIPEGGPRDPSEDDGPVRTTEPDLPPRNTLPDLDEAPPETPDEPAQPARPAKSWVYWLIGTLLFASVAGPLSFYFLVWRYRATAPQHIPAGTTFAARFDGRELYLYGPFREHVLSAFEDAPGVESYRDRIKSRTGIDLGSDVREVVVATMTGSSGVVLFGGRLGRTRREQDRFPEGLHAVLVEKGRSGFAMAGDVLVGPGFRVGQADDDTIIIATDDEILRAAMEPSDTWKTLGLSSSGAMSFTVQEPALAAAARNSPFGAGEALGRTERATGHLRLDKAKLYVDVVPKPGVGSEELARDIEAGLGAARALTLLLPDAYGEKKALGAARVRPRPETVMIETEWPREGIDGALESLGRALRVVLSGAPGS